MWVFLVFALFIEVSDEQPDFSFYVLLIFAVATACIVLELIFRAIEAKGFKKVREFSKTESQQ